MLFATEFDRALCIGINYVGSQCELRGCINDVISLKKEVKAKSYVVMTELAPNKKLIPTKANIINAMREFVKDVQPGEKLLFQYSGHGSYTLDRDGDEIDGRDETICPVDYAKHGDIVDDDIKKLLVEPLPEGSSLFCIFDCCHSGTVMDLRYNYRIYPKSRGKREFTIMMDEHYKKTKCEVVCLSGCKDNQTSADAYISRKFQGAMTWGLLTTMKELNAKKKSLTYKNLMKNLLTLMKKNGYSQVPQITAGHFLNLEDKLFK